MGKPAPTRNLDSPLEDALTRGLARLADRVDAILRRYGVGTQHKREREELAKSA